MLHMFFHRRKVQTYNDSNGRNRDRLAIPSAEDIVVEVDIDDGQTLPIPADLNDLHIGGAGASIPTELDPGIQADDMVRITVAHPVDGWSVTTPAKVEYKVPEARDLIRFGFAFVNQGNLYAQLDNAMVRYFNRRRGNRIFTSLDESFDAELKSNGKSIQGRVHDISRVGISLVVDKQLLERFRGNDALDVEFRLPGSSRLLQGTGKIIQKRELGEHSFIAVEFDIEDRRGFSKYQDRLSEYVLQRQHLTTQYEEALERGEVEPLPFESPPNEEAVDDQDLDTSRIDDQDSKAA